MLLEGPLSKWTNVMQGWQYRWFVLDEYHGLLLYYTSKDQMLKGQRRGLVRLKGAIIGIDSEDDSTFTIKVPGDHKTFHFQARDADEREQWTRALEAVIRQQNQGGRQNFAQRYRPNIPEFEKRIAESDAYLKILLDQIKNLKVKREGMKGTSRSKLDAIISSAEQMCEYIKHALVVLQIAKNECLNPSTGFEETPLTEIDLSDLQGKVSTSRFSESGDSEVGTSNLSTREGDLVSSGRRKLKDQGRQESNDSRGLPHVLPWTSYSSDDEFYDAEDTFQSSNANVTRENILSVKQNEMNFISLY